MYIFHGYGLLIFSPISACLPTVPPPPNAGSKCLDLVKKKITWSKLDLVCVYIKDFSVFKRIKKLFSQPIEHLVSKMTNHDI